MERLVCALFDTEEAASTAVQDLVDDGVSANVVSAVVHAGEIHHEDLALSATKSGIRSVEGVAIGGTIGAVLGGLIGGPAGLLAAGPLGAALIGGTTGGLYGGLAGALTGQDSEKSGIERLGAAVERGEVLVTVAVEGSDTDEHYKQVRRVLEAHGGRTVEVT